MVTTEVFFFFSFDNFFHVLHFKLCKVSIIRRDAEGTVDHLGCKFPHLIYKVEEVKML